MSQSNPGSDQAAKMASLVGQIGCVTGFASLIVIGIAFAVGRLLDTLLNTEPVFTILFLLGSFPITLFVIVRISLWALARAQADPSHSQADKENSQASFKEKAE